MLKLREFLSQTGRPAKNTILFCETITIRERKLKKICGDSYYLWSVYLEVIQHPPSVDMVWFQFSWETEKSLLGFSNEQKVFAF